MVVNIGRFFAGFVYHGGLNEALSSLLSLLSSNLFN